MLAAGGVVATAGCLFKATTTAVLAALGLKAYWKLSVKWCDSYTCLTDKTALITGANSGMGLITAKELAKRGARVILGCKSMTEGKNALCDIAEETGNCDIVVKQVDMASYKSVRAFAKEINETEKKLDILVNNAGVWGHDKTTLLINYTSIFLLTHLLMGKLKEAAPSRIVTISSIAARFIHITPKHVEALAKNPGRDLMGYIFLPYAYRVSKLCVIYFTTELAERIQGTGVTINTLHPGVVLTNLFKNSIGVNASIFDSFLSRLIYMTPEEGAQTAIHLCVAKELENVSGRMFTNCKQHEVYANGRNKQHARQIWEITEKLVNLEEHEKIRKT